MTAEGEQFEQPPDQGGWLQPGPLLGRKLIIPLDITVGKLSYETSRNRRRKAAAP